MKKIVIVLMVTFLMGCGVVYFHARNMSSLNLGMTKAEVVGILGKPISVIAKDRVEYLKYQTIDMGHDKYGHYTNIGMIYFVRLTDDKVDSYGELGDF
jgi:hypothetical protein